MGASYYKPITTWSKGEYANANNREDDLALISTYLGYAQDDHGNTASAATPVPSSECVAACGGAAAQ